MRLADRYTSPAWLAREADGLWPRAWLLAGASVDVARPGQRLRLDIAADSVLVVRGAGGVLRAFHNVCPHRGHRLCEAPHAHGSHLQCPYHRWTFDLTGALTARPDDAGFSERPGLSPVRCGEVAGLVWVCMSPDAPGLTEWLGPVIDWLAPYRFERLSLTDDVTRPVPCNWKLMLDANNEHYHLHTIHPELLGMIDDTAVVTERAAPHGRMVVPVGLPSGRRGRLSEQERASRRAAMLSQQRARLLREGVDLTGLPDDRLLDNHMLYVFPNVQLNCYADRLQIFRHRPHPTDPARAFFDRFVLSARPGAPQRYTTHRVLSETDSLGPVLDADVAVVRSAQRGMTARGFTGPVFGEGESLIAMMHETLGAWLGRVD